MPYKSVLSYAAKVWSAICSDRNIRKGLRHIMTCEEFIKNHTMINYCEAIIMPDGSIIYARPSHVETLIKLTKKPRTEINKLMPMRAAPINWLVEYTGCACVWFDYCIMPYKYTDAQIAAIQALCDHGIMARRIDGIISAEKTNCELLDKFDKADDSTDITKQLIPLQQITIERTNEL